MHGEEGTVCTTTQLLTGDLPTLPIGCLYVVLGIIGLILNLLTFTMILFKRVYRLSAYTIMANVALADAFVIVVAGVGCGVSILLYSSSSHQIRKATSADFAIPTCLENFINRSTNSTQHGHVLSLSEKKSAQHEQLGHSPFKTIQSTPSVTRYKRGGWHFLNKRRKYLNSDRRRKRRIWRSNFLRRIQRSSLVPTPDEFLNVSIFLSNSSYEVPSSNMYLELIHFSMAFVEIAACYAFLGINRCVAICFYGTKARAFNKVSIAILSSAFTWMVGIIAACVGTFPKPLIGVRLDMWTVSFVTAKYSRRFIVFISVSLLINCLSVALQWISSTLVLMKIRQVKKKISKNKVNQNSANRFRKQARLTFQFFYPSLFCTISSILYFAKPFISHLLSDHHFMALHIIWLSNHFCNPFIYAYFNERMRKTYCELLSCAQLRFMVTRKRRETYFKNRINVSRRPAGQHLTSQRQSKQRVVKNRSNPSIRSESSRSNGTFVRNSLQMQSRDFEQLCEFMMRVNPLYESSEGWRESSSDLENELENHQTSNGECAFETKNEAFPAEFSDHKRSMVVELGRETLEHWAAFVKKASI